LSDECRGRGFALRPSIVDTPSTTSEPSPGAEQARWFSTEVHPHDGQLKAYLRGSFPAVRDVDDVVQESYLRIWKAKATQPIESAKAFLFKVARHLALDLLRRHRISPIEAGYDFDLSLVLDTAPDAAHALLNEDLFNHVVDALVTLPPRYRDVVEKVFVEQGVGGIRGRI